MARVSHSGSSLVSLAPENGSISSTVEGSRRNTAPREGRRLLRLKQAGEYLGVSRDTLRALIWKGELQVVRYKEHAPFLLDVRDLDSWIERHKIKF